MNLRELKELNLTNGQVKTYEALLELGNAGIQKIQEKTSLERRAIYDVLNKLIEKGLVTYTIEKKVKTYQITHPKYLEGQIEQKERILKSLKEKIPTITDLYNFKKPHIKAEVYRGNNALMAFLEEGLEHEVTYWIGGNSGIEQSSKEMYYFFKKWTLKRIEKKKFMYDLVDKGTHLEDYKPKDLKKHKKEFYKYCELPKNLKSPMVIIMYGQKVAQILWEKQPFAFVLESKEIHESFMKYFNYFWKEPQG